MKALTRTDWGITLAVILVVISGGCGGGTSPTSPASPPPTAPPSASPSTAPPPVGSLEAVCRSIGYGTPKVGCDHIEVASLLPAIETAIDRLVAAEPGIFDVNSQMGAGGFRVLNEPAYFEGMQRTLAGMGICSTLDGSSTNIVVKEKNDLDETFAILNSKGFVRRGWGSYIRSCIPSSFPLSPEDQFSYVRVAFFGIKCDDPTVPVPPLPNGELPIVCSGIVTATPKDANGVNTPATIHGNDISWRLRSGEKTVAAYPALDGNIFNYVIQAKDVGSFSLCATVGGKEGCLNGRVTQYP